MSPRQSQASVMSENEVLSQWLDPEEVKSLAEGLLAKTPVSEIPSHESFFGDGFEGFDGDSVPREAPRAETPAPPQKTVPITPTPAPAPRAIVSKPVTPEPSVTPKAPVVTTPIQQNPFKKGPSSPARPVEVKKVASPFKVAPEEKVVPPVKRPPGPPSLPRALSTFGAWLKKQAPIQAAFVCDPEGKIIMDDFGSDKLVKVARSLVLASMKRQESGSLHVQIAEDRVMEILPLKFKNAHSIAGLIVARPLTPDAIAMIRRSFDTALERSSSPGE